jgi:hypothetical protein
MELVAFLLLLATSFAFEAGIFIGNSPPTSTFNLRNIKFDCPNQAPPPPEQIIGGPEVSLNSVLECLKSYTPEECSVSNVAPRLAVNLVEGAEIPSPPEEKGNAIVTFYVDRICKGKLIVNPSTSGFQSASIEATVFSPLPELSLHIATDHGTLFTLDAGVPVVGQAIILEGSAAALRDQLQILQITSSEAVTATITFELIVKGAVVDSETVTAFIDSVDVGEPITNLTGNGSEVVVTGNTTIAVGSGNYTNQNRTGGNYNVAPNSNVSWANSELNNLTFNVPAGSQWTCNNCDIGAGVVINVAPGATVILSGDTPMNGILIINGGIVVLADLLNSGTGVINLANGGILIIGNPQPPGRRRTARAGVEMRNPIDQAANAGAVIATDAFDLVVFGGTNIFRAQLQTDTVAELRGPTTLEPTASVRLGPNNNPKGELLVTGTTIMNGPGAGATINVKTTVGAAGRLQGVATVANVPVVINGRLAVGPIGSITTAGTTTFTPTSTFISMFTPTNYGVLVTTALNGLNVQPGMSTAFENSVVYTVNPPITVINPNGKVGNYPTNTLLLGGSQVSPRPGVVALIYDRVQNGQVTPPTPSAPAPTQTTPSVMDIIAPSKPESRGSGSKVAWIIPIALGGTLVVFIVIGAVIFIVLKKAAASAAAAANAPAVGKDVGYSPQYPPAPPVTPYGPGFGTPAVL